MNKRILPIALIAVLGTMATSCQKETITNPQSSITENCTVYTVQYAVNGVLHTSTLHGEDEYIAFIRGLMSLAREGYNVCVSNNKITESVLTKEKLEFTTNSEEEAVHWITERAKEGYTVYMSFDKETGIYSCSAVK